jgi:hypothetical protein
VWPKATLHVGLLQEFKSITAALWPLQWMLRSLLILAFVPLLIDKPLTICSTRKHPEHLTPSDFAAVKRLSECRVSCTNAVCVVLDLGLDSLLK